MGGKHRLARHLAPLVDCARRPGQLAWDPFCGGLSMSVALSANGPVLSSDKNPALVALYNAVQRGWQPPTEVSRDEWRAARALPDTDPRKAFCAYGCSFGGCWSGGYVPPVDRHQAGGRPHRAAALGVKRKVASVRGPIQVLDFLALEPRPIDAVIYCDPVYRGVNGYPEVGAFDHDRFVERVRGWSQFAHVFVSEYRFPIGREIWSAPTRTSLDGKRNDGRIRATERLYFVRAGGLH